MNTITPAIKDFVDRYARSRSVQDIDLIAAHYPDAFMNAGPNGAQVAQKSAGYRRGAGGAALNVTGTDPSRSAP